MSVNKQDLPKVIVLGVILLAILATLLWQVISFNTAVVNPSRVPTGKVASTSKEDNGGFESIVAPPGPSDPNTNPFREVLARPEILREPDVPSEITGELPNPVGPVRPIVPTPEERMPEAPRLTGILLGSTPLAVFLLQGTSHTAAVGDKLPNGYQVLAITDGEAVLGYGNRQIRLRIGE